MQCAQDERILRVWGWCSDAYLQYGYRLTFPAKTDPVKTYQWRYTSALVKKFDEWNFDDETAQRFIDIAANYAKEINAVRKGLAIFHQGNILSVCYERLKGDQSQSSQVLESLSHIHNWLATKIGDKDPVECLLQRADMSFCNLTKWYQASRISALYLACSKKCNRALIRLNQISAEERQLFPSTPKLYLLRHDFLRDRNNIISAKSVLQGDWRESCP